MKLPLLFIKTTIPVCQWCGGQHCYCLFLLLTSIFLILITTECCMRARTVWSRAARSSRPRRTDAAPTSTTAPPTRSASSSLCAEPLRSSLRIPWQWQTSAWSSPARARHRHTPSAKWTGTWTVAWWVTNLPLSQPFLIKSQKSWWRKLCFKFFQWGSNVFLCYKKSVSASNSISYKAGE